MVPPEQGRCVDGVPQTRGSGRELSDPCPSLYCARSSLRRRGGRVAEGARLESVYTGNRIVGSNPTPSANVVGKTLSSGLQRQAKVH